MKGTQQATTTSAFGFLPLSSEDQGAAIGEAMLARGDGTLTLLAIHNAMNAESSPESLGFLEVMRKRLA